jgi:outer membrane protein
MMKNVMTSMLVLAIGSLAYAQTQTQTQAPAPAVPPAQAAPVATPAPPPPTKIGVILLGQALLSTKEGQKAAADINAKFSPKKAEFDQREAELASLQDQLKKGGAAMSDDARAKLQRELESKGKIHQRKTQDDESDMQQDESRIMQELQNKMQQVVAKYASQNGYMVVLDVNNQAGPMFWVSPATDITAEMIKLYDDTHPVAVSAPTPSVKPTAPKQP